MVDKVNNKMLWTAGFFALGAAAVIAKKGLTPFGKSYVIPFIKGTGTALWSGTKKAATFALKDGQISGPTGVGVLAGTAAALSYKYSPIAAEKTQSDNRSVLLLTRAGLTAGSTLVVTALFVRYVAGKFGSHQVTRLGALSYALTATAASLAALSVLDRSFFFLHNLEKVKEIFVDLKERLDHPAAAAETSLHPGAIAAFWENLHRGDSHAKVFSENLEAYQRIGTYLTPSEKAQYLMSVEDKKEIPTILNKLYEDPDWRAQDCAALFLELDEATQEEYRDALHDDIKGALSDAKQCLENQREEIEMGRLEMLKEAHDAFADYSAISWNDTARVGILSGVAAGVAAATLLFGVKLIASLGNAFPVIKGTVPTALVLSTSYFAARTVIDQRRIAVEAPEINKQLLSIATATVAGVVLTSLISRLMLEKPIGFFAGAGFSVLAGSSAALALLAGDNRGEISNFFRALREGPSDGPRRERRYAPRGGSGFYE